MNGSFIISRFNKKDKTTVFLKKVDDDNFSFTLEWHKSFLEASTFNNVDECVTFAKDNNIEFVEGYITMIEQLTTTPIISIHKN